MRVTTWMGAVLAVAAILVPACGGGGSTAGTGGAGGAGSSASSSKSSGASSSKSSSASSSSATSSATSSSSGGGACTPITLSQIVANMDNPNWIDTAVSPDVGTIGGDPDLGSIELYLGDTPMTGTINLGAGDEANYKTCTHCVLVYDGGGKVFFQESGTMVISKFGTGAPPDANVSEGTLTNVKLIEVTLDEMDATSTPVPGGACLTLASVTWDTLP